MLRIEEAGLNFVILFEELNKRAPDAYLGVFLSLIAYACIRILGDLLNIKILINK